MKKDGEQEVVENATPTKRQAYLDYMASMSPDFNSEDEEALFEDMLNYRQKNEDSRAQFAKILTENPQLAQVMSDMASGKRGMAASFARYFGKDLLSAEEGSDEWNEIQEAEKERQAELDEIRARQDEFNKNIEASVPVLDEFAKKKGIDTDEFLDSVYEKMLAPIFAGTYTPELLEMLYKAMNYDTDVEDSFQSGVVAGKNERIAKMRKENAGDGLPRLGASSGVDNKPQKKKIPYRSSTWDM